MGSGLPGQSVRDSCADGVGWGLAPQLCCLILIHGMLAQCVLQVVMAGGREVTKAAFDEKKINKQAGNCAGLYLLQDDSEEPV